ncbi:MAG: hypothetical protein ACODAQ_01270, partial [Phycisphaeraceae bacterium]
MNTTTLTHELDAALDLLKDRLHRPLVAELEAGDFADNLLAHFRQRRTPVLPFTAERLPEIARLAQERDPEEHAWVKRIADEAIAGRLYGASNPYADHFIEVPDDFDFSAIDGPDPQTIHGLNRHRWFAALARHYW